MIDRLASKWSLQETILFFSGGKAQVMWRLSFNKNSTRKLSLEETISLFFQQKKKKKMHQPS
jgi:hypothetical protein